MRPFNAEELEKASTEWGMMFPEYVLDQLVARNPDADDLVRACRIAHRVDDIQRAAQALSLIHI